MRWGDRVRGWGQLGRVIREILLEYRREKLLPEV